MYEVPGMGHKKARKKTFSYTAVKTIFTIIHIGLQSARDGTQKKHEEKPVAILL